MRLALLPLLAAVLVTRLPAQAPQDPHAGMHGGMVMGFDQDKTTHHFLLYEDGGAIDISVKDGGDAANRAAIREHLSHLAGLFAAGDFSAPMLVHETKDVPGTPVMAARKTAIAYAYAETPAGGRVNITTTDRDALAAVHAFLTYQITEHRTGDSRTPKRRG